MKEHISKVYTEDMELSDDAKWIHAPNAKPAHWYILRREFDVSGERAVLAFGACHYAEVYINGILAMRFCERSYLYSLKYKCTDISNLVKQGRNTLTVIMDRMFDENRLSDIIAQIDCEGVSALVSDGGFKAADYAPMLPGANFFVEGSPKCEVFDARKDMREAFFTGFDDSAWENAETEDEELAKYTFSRISQDKNEMQTSYPVFAESYVSLEKSAAEKSVCVKVMTERAALCEAELTAEVDTSVYIENAGGVFAFALDGERITEGAEIKLTLGTHRLSLIGVSPSVCIVGEGAALGEWKKRELPMPEKKKKKRVPNFPWNGIAGEKKARPEWEAVLTGADGDLEPAEAENASAPALGEVKHRSYFSSADSFADARLGRKYAGTCDLLVSGKDSVFSEDGEMIIEPSDKDTSFILDFGTVRIGGIRLEAKAKEGTPILVHAFEAINGDGVIFCSEGRTMRYICAEGENAYTSHVRRGFRYLSVTVPASDTRTVIKNIYLDEWRFPAESVTDFFCSDARLCDIYKMSVDTAKACMLDAYVDCPGYEQNIWVGDARVTAAVNLTNFGRYGFNSRFLSLVADSIDDGMQRLYRRGNKRYKERRFLPCASFPTYPEGNIPIWSYMWVLAVLDHYRYTGDTDALTAVLPAVEETFARSEAMMNGRGLLSIRGAWNLIEWANNDISEYGECVANSMMLSYCLAEFAKVYSSLGKEELARKYSCLSSKIKEAVNKYAWSEERGAYIDTVRDGEAYEEYLSYYDEIGKEPVSFETFLSLERVSVQTNTFAVLYGIAEGERREKALSILVENIEKGVYIAGSPIYRTAGEPTKEEAPGGIVHIGSPFFMFFALETLFKNGYAPLALKSIRREWGDMLDSGITTCTESFNSKTEWKTRSVAHAWSASPAVYLMTELLGIKPVKPGFAEFTVCPCESPLEYAKGSMPTPYGEIYVEWRKDGAGNTEINCVCPPECKRV